MSTRFGHERGPVDLAAVAADVTRALAGGEPLTLPEGVTVLLTTKPDPHDGDRAGVVVFDSNGIPIALLPSVNDERARLKPAPWPLRLRLVGDDREIDFDADPFPLVGVGAVDAGGPIATRIVTTVARRGVPCLWGRLREPDGTTRRVSIDVAAIAWIDDRRDLLEEAPR